MKEINFPDPIIKDLTGCMAWSGLSVLRDDIVHPYISGNKWRKLKGNLAHLAENNIKTIVTFGGAFSNHIHATAAACYHYNIQCVGIIRGEYDKDNPTLAFAKSQGMILHFVDRQSYREKEKSQVVKKILTQYSNYFLIPEGGSNQYSYQGLAELSQIINKTDFDVIMVSAGTGYTAAGILKSLKEEKKLWVFPSLKDTYIKDKILSQSPKNKHNQLTYYYDYHLGGYAKVSEKYIAFINQFVRQTGVEIDPIYNAKILYGFYDLVINKKIDVTKKYLWIHTGGLQGIDAYNYMSNKKNSMPINRL
ncbi:MAG: pyridoxal-phosphate dependent enzyme [Saprospiraceae bacterium]